jgi:TonB-dependent receptor
MIKRMKFPFKKCDWMKVGLLTVYLMVGSVLMAQNPNQKITLNVQNISLKELIKQVESKTTYTVVYRDLLVDDKKDITINEENKPLVDILKTCLSAKGLQVVFNNNTIVITKKNAEPQITNKPKKVSGVVLDEKGLPVIGASIIIPGTSIGVATDVNGRFKLEAPANAKLRISYIGYVPKEELLDANSDLQIKLEPTPKALKEVFVTAQALGQRAAINQQINSLTIKNVVSADRIRQIPDANAAEAIGRLPGVTVTRSGGEANGIVVRGMQGYNNVTINGVDVPVNLTSISQYALQSVEVFKSVSADMDASAPAGTVNLKLGIAPDRNSTSVMVQAGYSDLNKTYQNYKFNISSNWRFFEKKFGLSLNLSTEATDRSTEQLTADIGTGNQAITEGQPIKLQTNAVTLRNVDRTVKRNSAILTSDFRFSPTASIEWSNIVTHSPGGALNVSHNYVGGAGNSSYSINDNTGNNGYNYSSILTAKHMLGNIKVDYSASFGYAYNYSETRNTSFFDLKAYKQTLNTDQMQNLSHQDYIGLAQIDNTTETMNRYKLTGSPYSQPGLDYSTSNSNNANIDLRMNMELPFSIGSIISGSLKWGGRYKRQDYEQETFGIKKESYYFPGILLGTTSVPKEDGTRWNDDIHLTPNDYDINGQVMGSYLLDNSNYNNNFLNQGYNFGWYPNMQNTNALLDWYDNLTNYAYSKGQSYWQPIWGQIMALQKEDFNGNARGTKSNFFNHYAGYLMAEINIGKTLNFVPGVRYEKYHYDMNSWNIREEIISSLQLTGEPVNGTHDNEYLLPMVQLKYKPLNWLQGLFSYTETLKRPSVGQIEPYVNENKITKTYDAGNPNLKPEHWTSIDLGVAVHNKKIGLFSVNLFYKKVKDKIAITNWTKMSIDKTTTLGSFQPEERVDVTQTLNHPYDGIAKGIEVEWQTNFWYLPKPFSYFILNLNYSYINNKTTYVYAATRDSLIGYGRGNRPIYEKVRYDNLVQGPMTNQPSHLFNGSLGFSYKKFSTYLSYQYIGEVFQSKAVIPELDSFKNAFHRVDLQANYKFLKGMEILLNVANISDATEEKKLRGDNRPTSIERYGLTADLGLRFTF